MHAMPADFAANYRNLPDQDIADLYADIASLTPEARDALSAEIQHRGLNEAQLLKLRADELRHEAQFERLEKFRRKKLAWGNLPRTRGEWIFLGVALFGLTIWGLISDLISRHH